MLTCMPAFSTACNLVLILLLLLSFALLKGWFKVNGKAVTIGIWVTAAGVVILSLVFILNYGEKYQIERLKAFASPFEYQEIYLSWEDYNSVSENGLKDEDIAFSETASTYSMVRNLLAGCKFVGHGSIFPFDRRTSSA